MIKLNFSAAVILRRTIQIIRAETAKSRVWVKYLLHRTIESQ